MEDFLANSVIRNASKLLHAGDLELINKNRKATLPQNAMKTPDILMC